MSAVETEQQTPVEAARQLLGLNEEPEPDEPAEPEGDEEGEDGEETEEPASSSFPSFVMQLPDDLAEELALEEALAVQDEDVEEEEGYGRDPELMKRLRAAEKEAAYYRSQRITDGRKLWEQEAKQFFPLSEPFLDELPAESRREYLRQAKALQVKLQPFWEERVEKPTALLIEGEREKARREAREAAEIAWGRPPGTMAAPSAASQALQRQNGKINQGDLVGTIKAMLAGQEGL
jgi:hypothetical protein